MPKSIAASDLALFQCYLIGEWTNAGVPDHQGKPLSYNVMPLPQLTGHPPNRADFAGYILKNFAFTETIKFHGSINTNDPPQHQEPGAIATTASAPNRGGSYSQIAQAVFYDQQVQFAEGPQGPKHGASVGDVVHVENGAWLYLKSVQQAKGAYDTAGNGPYVPGDVYPQPPYINIAKQIAVPHGNSVLALGSFDVFGTDSHGEPNPIFPGAPAIPDAFPPYPEPPEISIDPYKTHLASGEASYENPNPEWTWNPNRPLQIAVDEIAPRHFIHWRVTTQPLLGGKGEVTNIPFEQRKSNVDAYWADYWLLSTDGVGENFDYLAYSQTILMKMEVSQDEGQTFRKLVFPHVTTNTVKRV